MHIYMTVQGRIIELFLPSVFDQLITKKYLQIKISEETIDYCVFVENNV